MSETPPQIETLDAGGAGKLLERLDASGLVAAGQVNLISVRAIRDRAGERWARRREDVWEHVQKKLHERLSHGDLHARVNETDFLIAMPSETAAGAQGVALRLLEEVLEFFLGAADALDLDIRTVTRASGSELVCEKIDPVRVASRAAKSSTATLSSASPAPRIDPREEALRNPVTFVTAAGAALRVDFAAELVISLKHNMTAAVRIEPTVTLAGAGVLAARNFSKLSDEDVAAVDRATLRYAALYGPEGGGNRPTPVIAPTTYRTLSTQRGRGLLMGAAEVHAWMRTSLMLELIDYDRGIPGSRLIEVVGLLNGLSRGVFARIRPGKGLEAPVHGVRLQGLTLDGADLAGSAQKTAALLLDVGAKLKGAAPALVAQGLAAEGFLDVANVAGFSHAALRLAPQTLERESQARGSRAEIAAATPLAS